MNFIKKIALTLLVSVCAFSVKATNVLSDSLQVSMITVSPGNELYSVFGHTAIRVKDFKNGHDIVFNYGTFDFRTPNFYLKFAMGVLDYQLSVEQFQDFLGSCMAEKRSVYEQTLVMPEGNKRMLVSLLLDAYSPENRAYRYRFFTNNCATKVRDVIVAATGDYTMFDNANRAKDSTFRKLFTSYLPNMKWERFGIELVLGKMTDEKSENDAMFLPNNLMDAVSKAKVAEQSIAPVTERLFVATGDDSKDFPFTPVMAMFILVFVALGIQFLPSKVKVFDTVFFLITGFLGIFIATLSIASTHPELHFNMVALLIFPINFFLPFIKNVKWKKNYCMAIFILAIGVIALSPLLPQKFNPAVLLLGLAVAIRLFYNFVMPNSFLIKNKSKIK